MADHEQRRCVDDATYTLRASALPLTDGVHGERTGASAADGKPVAPFGVMGPFVSAEQ